jgi:GNAT superfamily N-acetyltransferase
MTITVGPPEAQDRDAWEALYHGYGVFYEVPITTQKLEAIWSWIVDDKEAFYCLIAKDSQGICLGLMHYREMASPLRGSKVGFLDDLFVDSAHRGKGVVEALFSTLEEDAKKRGWPLIRWLTGDDNYRARAVYDKLATRTMWLTYQMDIADSEA